MSKPLARVHSLDGHLAAEAADHHGQFTFEVHVVAELRTHDHVVGADHRGVRFHENQRLGRHFAIELGGMGRIVLADRKNLAARDDRGEQPGVVQGDSFTGVVDRTGERITVDHRDGVGELAFIGLQLDDSETRVSTGNGKTSNTHDGSLLANGIGSD